MRFDLSSFQCLGEAIRECGVPLQSRTALVEIDRERETGRWTHREVHREAERFGALLQESGFAAGERCAILMPNQAKWVLSALGVLWSGGVLVPLDSQLTPPEQAALLGHCRPRVLIIDAKLWERLAPSAPGLAEAVRVFVTEAPEGVPLHGARRWEEVSEVPFRYVGRRRDDVATIVYSSGTGGKAKGCMLTHENYLRQVEQLGNIVRPTEEDRYLSIIPANHAIDFMCGFLIPLLCGTWIVHPRTLRSQFLLAAFQRYRITLTAMVPLLLKALRQGIEDELAKLSSGKAEIYRLARELRQLFPAPALDKVLRKTVFKPVHDRFGGALRQILAGGAFVEQSLCDYFFQLGIPIAVGYGMTEAGTAITLNDLRPYRGDTVGKPVPGTRVDVRDPDAHGVGEVWVKGPGVMKGYFGDPELTREVLVDGWLRTGDLGRLDASGHLKLVGRAKNMIVTAGGKNVYPEDLEAALGELRDCEEYCVFAANYLWPQRRLTGETLVLVFRPKPSVAEDEYLQDLRARNRGLADYKRISALYRWDEEFPRTATMKIKRQQLADQIRLCGKGEGALRAL